MQWSVVHEKAIRDDGSLLFPQRLSHEFLAEARRTMGSMLFANQYLNEVIPEGEQPFRREWIRYFESVPSNLFHFAFIDPAIGESKVHDYTAIVIVSTDTEKKWYVRRAVRHKWNPSQIVQACFDIHKEWKPVCIGIEDVAFQRALIHFALEEAKRRGVSLPVTGVKRGPDKSKEMRILSLIPRFEWGTLYLAPHLHDLEMELAQFPRGAHDDLCFVAGTKVLTPRGLVNIETLCPGDLVLTPLGLDEITHTSQSESSIITNHGLQGTAGHKVWTWSGLKRLDALSDIEDISQFKCKHLIRWASLSSYISIRLNSEEWVGRDCITYLSSLGIQIGERGRLGFMLLFMSFFQEERYLQSITFTIKTVIRSITALKIWSAYQLRSMQDTLVGTLKRWLSTLKRLGLWPLFGTDQKRAGGGIVSMEETVGLADILRRPTVLFAINHSEHIFHLEPRPVARAVIQSSYIDKDLSLNTENVVFANLALERERTTRQRPVLSHAASKPIVKRVYNIKTKRHRLYYANGILVSNCDALSSIEDIVSYPQPIRRKDEKPNPADAEQYEKWFIRQLSRGARDREEIV